MDKSFCELLKDQAFQLVAHTHLGERCRFCGKVYRTLADLSHTVWAGYHENGRLACQECWDEAQKKESENR